MKKKLSAAAAVILLAACYLLFNGNGPEAPLPEGQLEIPAPSAADHIVVHEAYTSSYNTTTLIPNWVAYELTEEETYGDVERGDRMFRMDPDLDTRQAKREDYYNSGWTKGHMIPASDVRWSASGMDETFYFTNVCPQNEVLNAGDWEYLERQVRRWAREFGTAYIVTGPIVGEGKYGRIGDREVTVPDAFFKAVLCPDGPTYHAIAFVMNNDDRRYYLDKCAMSIDRLEEMTGLDLFPALEDDIENMIESRFSLKDWNIRTK